jgi:hypothetical protein
MHGDEYIGYYPNLASPLVAKGLLETAKKLGIEKSVRGVFDEANKVRDSGYPISKLVPQELSALGAEAYLIRRSQNSAGGFSTENAEETLRSYFSLPAAPSPKRTGTKSLTAHVQQLKDKQVSVSGGPKQNDIAEWKARQKEEAAKKQIKGTQPGNS